MLSAVTCLARSSIRDSIRESGETRSMRPTYRELTSSSQIFTFPWNSVTVLLFSSEFILDVTL